MMDVRRFSRAHPSLTDFIRRTIERCYKVGLEKGRLVAHRQHRSPSFKH